MINHQGGNEMWQRIREAFRWARSYILPSGIIAFLLSLFTGQWFQAVLIGGVLYFYWKNEHKINVLLGTI